MVLCSVLEIGKNLVGKCVGPIAGCVQAEVSHLWNYKANVESLIKEAENLRDATESVKRRIEEAENCRGETLVDAVVETWQKRMASLSKEALNIIEDDEKATERCLMGLRPNLWACYLVSKKAKEVIDKAVALRDERREFDDRIATVDYSRSLGFKTKPDFKLFESRDHVSNDIVVALKDSSVSMVGVFGMGGVGKTTLVKKVAEQLYRDQIFNCVVTVSVSHNPVKNIQKEIAEQLGITLDVDSETLLASRIEAVLEKKEKLLIILDDIWRGIELEKVGIPFGDGLKIKLDEGDDDHHHNKYFKILMTSRSESVLCNEMGSSSNFFLQVLSRDDAWNLFEKTLGGVRKDPRYQSVAAQVVEKCSGIPILLVTIAKALRNKELVTWNDALSQLKRCHPDKLVSDAYKMIEVSYNFLNGEEIKSLFLLCGQLDPSGFPIADLLKYTMGLGMFNGREQLKDASDRLHTYLRDLKDCCLLEDDNDEGEVKMHDVVHKLSAYIGERDHQMFSVADGELQKWPPKNKLEQFTAISLFTCHLPPPDHQLPAAFDNPKLKSFLVIRENFDASLKVPDNFFIGMKGLKLLDLTEMRLSSVLPSSLSALVNLRTLCLDYCVLNDIAIIGELPMLQVLSLVGSSIVKLPAEIGKLGRSLQLLDLCFCSKLKVIVPGVLSKLTLLEELRIEDSFNEWEQEGCSSGTETRSTENKASLGELRKLPNLINLDIHIPDANMFPKDLVFKKLERFRIVIGELDSDWDAYYETSKSLILELDEGAVQLDDHGIKDLMRTAEGLYLGKLKGFESLSELDAKGFPQLKHLNAKEEVEIQYIVKRSYNSIVVFPELESLVLDNLPNLERIICHVQMLPAVESFKNLTTIEVNSCNVLKDLFSSQLAKRLLCLLEISVYDCESMETIVSIESGNRKSLGQQLAEEEIFEFTQLRALTLYALPRLKSFYSNLNPIIPSSSARSRRQEKLRSDIVEENHELTSSTPLFDRKIVFPKLEELDLYGIEVEKIWDYQLAITAERTCWLQNLTSLIVDNCENLSYLFTSPMIKSLAQLEKLEVTDCSSIKEIVATNLGEMAEDKLLFPKLDNLILGDLPELIRFCHGNLIECPLLRKLRITNCPELKTFIGTNDESVGVGANSSTLFCEKVAFPILEELKVTDMEHLKMIWGNKLHLNSFSKLKDLQIVEAGGLLNVFPPNMWRSAQNLEYLKIIDCDLLEKIFGIQISTRDVPRTQNLRFVTVLGCPNLESVFPASVALALQQLEQLKIRDCEGMEKIVSKEEDNTCPTFVFPKLTSLSLLDLPELEKFYPGPHASEWPSLNKATVRDCDKADISDASFSNIISTSKECYLERDSIKMTYKSLCGELKVYGRGQQFYPIALLERFQQLEKVVLSGFYFSQLFPCQPSLVDSDDDLDSGDDYDIGTQANTLARIQNLQLIRLKGMKHIWSEHSQVNQILKNLKSLEVRVCGNLITLAPPATLFKNLTYLDVDKCRQLTKLLTFANARSLVRLKEMRVSSCSSLTEIVVNVGYEANKEDIVFGKLEKLTLHSLTSLTSFCPKSNCNFQFPSLENLVMEQCPKMEFFSKGTLTTPRLRRVRVNIEDEEDAHWEGDLDSTVRQLNQEMVGLHGQERLRLSEFPELNDKWLDEFSAKQSSNLKFLEVNECTFASYAISSSRLLSLNNLKELRVTNCKSLEEIFDGSKDLQLRNRNVGLLSKLNKFYLADLPSLRHIWPENFEQILVFKNLTMLNICNCSSLRYVFTPSMAPCLAQLQKIQVENCALMEQIFHNGEKEKGMGAETVLIFPQLNSIILQSLPCLASFYYGNGVLDCPYLKKITIIDCPKMEMFISPSLRENVNIKESHKRLGDGDLYPSVKAFFNDKVVFPKLEELKLVGVDGLNMIWQNDHELHPKSFFSLETLEIKKGGTSLLSIFPGGMLGRRLNNLENLTVSKCVTRSGI